VLLKKSLFNIKVDELDDGRVLLFNSITTNFGIVKKDVWVFYQDHQKFDPEGINNQNLSTQIQTMKDYGFLVNDDMDEKKRLKVSERLTRYNSQDLSLTIAPTLNCNMACPYCYEQKGNNGAMSSDVISGIVSFVENYMSSHKVRRLNIVWYGGEPLLELNTITKLAKYLHSLCSENGVKYYSGIITNGSLLTYEVAEILKNDCNVSYVQVTIDGLKEIHLKFFIK
jgi:uncharacterized protein